MGSFITTLKDDTKTNDLIPRTRLKCIADENGNYINNSVTASDINSIVNRLMKYSADSSQWDTTPTNGSTKPCTSGGIYSAINAISNKFGGFTIRRGSVYNTTVTIDNVLEGILFIMRPEYNMGSTYYIRDTVVFTHYAQIGLVVAKPTTYTLTITESNDTTRFYILLSRT